MFAWVFPWIAITLSLLVLSACTSIPTERSNDNNIDVAIPLAEWKQQAKYTRINGHRIAYWDAGKGEPLILVHGFPASAWSWQFIMPELTKHFRVIAPDLLGYGLSDKPWPHEYTIGEQADIVMGLAKTLDIKKYHLMGHDFGASTVQELLARNNRHLAARFKLALLLREKGSIHESDKHINLLLKLDKQYPPALKFLSQAN